MVNREELVQLHDAIGALLALPDRALEQLARWLAPEAAPRPGNGLDHDPPPIASAGAETSRSQLVDAFYSGSRIESPRGEVSPPESATRRAPAPGAGKARPAKAAKATAGERRLLAAMEASPGASANALAKAAAISRSTAADGLKRLAARGAIEKDGDGRWRVKGEASSQTQGASARPIQPPAAMS